MNLSSISSRRTELMGFAMLIVVWYHLSITTHILAIDFLRGNGCIGVDIFLLLSGFGLAYSTKNGLRLSDYLLKRAIRILPIYALIICGVSFIKGDYDLGNLIYKITTVGWWTNNGAYDWFIPNLILLYLLYPLFYLITKSKQYGIGIGCFIVFTLYIITCCMPYGSDFMSYCRYPTFFLGAILGRLSFDFPAIGNSKKMKLMLIFATIVGCIMCIGAGYIYSQPNLDPTIRPEIVKNGWKFFPYFWIVPGACMMLGSLFLSFKIFNPILRWVGAMSLEVYLLHGQFIELTRYLSDLYGYNKAILGAILVTISFAVAYAMHLINIRIMGTLKRKMLAKY